jgi:hypothetical protein
MQLILLPSFLALVSRFFGLVLPTAQNYANNAPERLIVIPSYLQNHLTSSCSRSTPDCGPNAHHRTHPGLKETPVPLWPMLRAVWNLNV